MQSDDKDDNARGCSFLLALAVAGGLIGAVCGELFAPGGWIIGGSLGVVFGFVLGVLGVMLWIGFRAE